jgi:hypothetical protein
MSRLKKGVVIAVALILCLGAIGILTSKQGDENTEDLAFPDSSQPFGSEKGDVSQGSDEDIETAVGEEDRVGLIPTDAVKMTPEADPFPPILHHPLWEEPEPMPYPINTAGAEDSPFISPCGSTFYFWYTPIACSSLEGQINDGVTGIWYSKKTADGWSDAKKLALGEEPSLDGCPFVQDDVIWFCSARTGNYRGVDIWAANLTEGRAVDLRNVGERLNVEVGLGELHISSDWNEIYFHSDVEGGKGGRDIWVTRRVDGEWSDPKNVEAVNSEADESLPFLTLCGGELWITRWYRGYPAVYRSVKVDGEWTRPDLIVSQFAAEPTLDAEGNVYFVHHFIQDGVMLEADIYVSRKGKPGEPSDNIEPPGRGYYLGVLPIPAEGQSFEAAYKQAAQTSELVPVWGRPSPFYEMHETLEGDWGETFVESLTRENGMATLVHLSFIGQDLTLIKPPMLWNYNMSDEEWRQSYKDAALWTVETAKPKFLSVGNEVNRWYEKYGLEGENGFKHFVSLYEEIYDAVKEVSPGTIVFCTFSREIVMENREANMDVLDLFNPDKLDMLVLTSYPHSVQGINRPQDISPEYYYSVASRIPDKPFGFSEVAWPSMDAFGGEQAQADFLGLLTEELTLDEGVDLKLLMWPWLHDIAENDYTGLIRRDGTLKLGHEKWVKISER